MEWKKVNEKILKGDGWQKLLLRRFVLPDGKESDFEIKLEKEVACVLAITEENNVVLAKQFRPGPEKVLLELPGGCIEAGENPEESARREFLEETGYTGNMKFVRKIYDCGYSTRIAHCFVATDCKKVKETDTDDTEFIEVVEMTLEKFKDHLRSGHLTDTDIAYVGLDYLKLL